MDSEQALSLLFEPPSADNESAVRLYTYGLSLDGTPREALLRDCSRKLLFAILASAEKDKRNEYQQWQKNGTTSFADSSYGRRFDAYDGIIFDV